MTTNDAAERLREYLGLRLLDDPLRDLLDAALAAERRATVEAIADLVEGPNGPPLTTNPDGQQVVDWDAVERAILDKEAER